MTEGQVAAERRAHRGLADDGHPTAPTRSPGPAASKSGQKAAGGKKKDNDSKGADSAEAAMRGSGTLQVGSGMRPGTYRTTGNTIGDNCYWDRDESAGHEPGALIADESPEGSAVVTIGVEDAYFKTTGRGVWKKSS